jgi:hypothetical protein
MKLNEIAVDVEREEEGDWTDIPTLPGIRVKIRSIHSAAHRRLQSKLMRRVTRATVRGADVDIDEIDRINTRCLLEAVLLDWEGITDDKGKPVPYSREMAETLLTDRKYRKFRDGVAWAAQEVGDQDLAALEAAAKN